MKKPAKCVTPKRDREFYKLTARDLNAIFALVKEANDMLSYYINMPENETGELATTQFVKLEKISEQIDDLSTTLNEVVCL